MSLPNTWTLKGFCSHFQFVHTKMHDHAFAWILGAGASRSSGIPTGGELVDAWLHELHQRTDSSGQSFEDWASAKNLEIEDFSLSNAAAFYSKIYERRFNNHPDEGYAYLEELMAGKDPSPGYSILAKAMESTRHRLVVTTNFDNLVADALAVYTDTFPFVVGHEALAGFVRAAMRRPLVCKIHRDLLLGPKSDPRSLKRLHETWAGTLRVLFAHYTPVFIGYGGNDDSLMDLLESLEQGDIKGQLIWCYYEKSSPSKRILDLVAHHRGVLVPVPDFDLLMILLGSVLGIQPLDSVIEERAKKRAENYRERILALDTTKHPDVAEALSSTLERAGGWWAWAARARREPVFDKREAIFRQGLHKFPKSPELHRDFAWFLVYDCERPEEAKLVMQKALTIDPQNVDSHTALAIINADHLENITEADELFQKALELNSDSIFTQIHYASFLATHQNKPEEADKLFRRLLASKPENTVLHIKYARFLSTTQKDTDASERHFRTALKLEPESTSTTAALAAFLSDHSEKSHEAALLFKRALELDPRNQSYAANYAEFLLTRHRFAEARTAIQHAQTLSQGMPESAAILGLFEALLTCIEGRDDSRLLSKLKGLIGERVPRIAWDLDRVERSVVQSLGEDDAKMYTAILNVIRRRQELSSLDAFERWSKAESTRAKPLLQVP